VARLSVRSLLDAKGSSTRGPHLVASRNFAGPEGNTGANRGDRNAWVNCPFPAKRHGLSGSSVLARPSSHKTFGAWSINRNGAMVGRACADLCWIAQASHPLPCQRLLVECRRCWRGDQSKRAHPAAAIVDGAANLLWTNSTMSCRIGRQPARKFRGHYRGNRQSIRLSEPEPFHSRLLSLGKGITQWISPTPAMIPSVTRATDSVSLIHQSTWHAMPTISTVSKG